MLIVLELNSFPCATYSNYMLQPLKSKPVIANFYDKYKIYFLYNKEEIFT